MGRRGNKGVGKMLEGWVKKVCFLRERYVEGVS